MRTADLTGALLDYYVARVEGVPADQLEIRAAGSLCVRNLPVVGLRTVPVIVLNYSTNWALTGPLLEKHEADLTYETDGDLRIAWIAATHAKGDTALIAICRAVVRAAFGDEVEDLPC